MGENTDPILEKADRQDVLIAFIDGGARGNPGPGGYGVYLQDANGKCIAELCEFLGVCTNNVAEYNALLAALRYAREYDYREVEVASDSELLVKQMTGAYKVSSPDLKPLCDEAKRMAKELSSFAIRHVVRAQNREADRLANEAMDRGMSMSSTSALRANAYERRPEPPPRQEFDGVVRNGVIVVEGVELPEGGRVRVRLYAKGSEK
jgi:ribonuclease HI